MQIHLTEPILSSFGDIYFKFYTYDLSLINHNLNNIWGTMRLIESVPLLKNIIHYKSTFNITAKFNDATIYITCKHTDPPNPPGNPLNHHFIQDDNNSQKSNAEYI